MPTTTQPLSLTLHRPSTGRQRQEEEEMWSLFPQRNPYDTTYLLAFGYFFVFPKRDRSGPPRQLVLKGHLPPTVDTLSLKQTLSARPSLERQNWYRVCPTSLTANKVGHNKTMK